MIRDEWNGPDADRKLHYMWAGATILWLVLACSPAILMVRSDSCSEKMDLVLAAVDLQVTMIPQTAFATICLSEPEHRR